MSLPAPATAPGPSPSTSITTAATTTTAAAASSPRRWFKTPSFITRILREDIGHPPSHYYPSADPFNPTPRHRRLLLLLKRTGFYLLGDSWAFTGLFLLHVQLVILLSVCVFLVHTYVPSSASSSSSPSPSKGKWGVRENLIMAFVFLLVLEHAVFVWVVIWLSDYVGERDRRTKIANEAARQGERHAERRRRAEMIRGRSRGGLGPLPALPAPASGPASAPPIVEDAWEEYAVREEEENSNYESVELEELGPRQVQAGDDEEAVKGTTRDPVSFAV